MRNIMEKSTLEEISLIILEYNVLVVDDQEGIRNLVTALLSQRGHSCQIEQEAKMRWRKN